MRIVWSPRAIRDRNAIWEYIASDDPVAATRVDTAFEETVDRLAEHPELGRAGLISGTRELLPISNYRIMYEISGQEVWILAIVHTSRLWPQ
ncbi:MAG: type II toxin-antitoxin system RelE/ParE family toxin [Leucobacter sp.]